MHSNNFVTLPNNEPISHCLNSQCRLSSQSFLCLFNNWQCHSWQLFQLWSALSQCKIDFMSAADALAMQSESFSFLQWQLQEHSNNTTENLSCHVAKQRFQLKSILIPAVDAAAIQQLQHHQFCCSCRHSSDQENVTAKTHFCCVDKQWC